MKKSYKHTITTILIVAEIICALEIIGGAYLVSLAQNSGWALMASGAAALAFFLTVAVGRKRASDEFIKRICSEGGIGDAAIMENMPVAAAIMHSDGSIRWHTESFYQIANTQELLDKNIEKLIPNLKWSYVLKNASSLNEDIKIGERTFNVRTKLIKSNTQKSDPYSIYMYFVEKTEEIRLAKAYMDERTVVASINIDNYDELQQKLNDSEEQLAISKIRKYISDWACESSAIVKIITRDKYFVLFEHQYMEHYIESKFDIIDKVRSVGEEIKLPVSISVGIGAGGNLSENEEGSRNALEMALGRGGDQVCVKDDTQYKFFGGKSKEYEKSTRVKTRAVAVALKDFIKQSDKVIFMGHSSADYDCFGAAMGLQRTVRQQEKQPYIIYDNNSPAIDRIYSEVKNVPEYKGMFISGEEAMSLVTSDTLLVVLDTHRPSMVACPELLETVTKIVLVDHHRRSTEFINPCSLVYHEPYASSVAEMATELVEYMDIGTSMTKLEAQCLYMGIIMDTKNFVVKTGVRTFEAASYLKRMGVNTMEIKKFFNMNKDEYDHKVDIVKTARIIEGNMAVAATYDTHANIRVSASQAADEMLNISDVQASFVVYPIDSYIGICARSLGTVNVQLIMEKLGGGGHMTMAGAQFKDETIESVAKKVADAISEYVNNAE